MLSRRLSLLTTEIFSSPSNLDRLAVPGGGDGRVGGGCSDLGGHLHAEAELLDGTIEERSSIQVDLCLTVQIQYIIGVGHVGEEIHSDISTRARAQVAVDGVVVVGTVALATGLGGEAQVGRCVSEHGGGKKCGCETFVH